jgi:hypothetical protein
MTALADHKRPRRSLRGPVLQLSALRFEADRFGVPDWDLMRVHFEADRIGVPPWDLPWVHFEADRIGVPDLATFPLSGSKRTGSGS